MGTPDWAIPSLQAVLDSGIEISAVFTQPDRRVGRKRVLTTSSIKQFTQNQNLSVHSPEKAGSPETLELVRSLTPELIMVCAYGQILPQSFLDIPRIGCFNLHFSLLPKYVGPLRYRRQLLPDLKQQASLYKKWFCTSMQDRWLLLPNPKPFVRMTQLRYSEADWQKLVDN